MSMNLYTDLIRRGMPSQEELDRKARLRIGE
jgi:hypothetical protein